MSNEELVREQFSFSNLSKLPLMGGINDYKQLPTIYGLPKMHSATPKLRFIAAFCKLTLKSADLAVINFWGVIYSFMYNYCKGIFTYIGILMSVITI